MVQNSMSWEITRTKVSTKQFKIKFNMLKQFLTNILQKSIFFFVINFLFNYYLQLLISKKFYSFFFVKILSCCMSSWIPYICTWWLECSSTICRFTHFWHHDQHLDRSRRLFHVTTVLEPWCLCCRSNTKLEIIRFRRMLWRIG